MSMTTNGKAILLVSFSLLTTSCGDEAIQPPTCAAENLLDQECVGTPPTALCESGPCTEGISCTNVVEVQDDASLDAALMTASKGTCIALADGTYGQVTLPASVSLVGRSADAVSLAGLSISGGQDAIVRGLRVGSAGISITDASNLRLESLRVTESTAKGINVQGTSIVTLVQTTISNNARQGIAATDGSSVILDRVLLEENGGPGLTASCTQECSSCPVPPKVSMMNSIVRGNHIGGITLATSIGMLNNVHILDTRVGDQWMSLLGGGGLTVHACADVMANGLYVARSDAYGILVDRAHAILGADGTPEQGVLVTENTIGIWLQKSILTSELHNATVENNKGVGIGMSGDTQGVIICKSRVSGTQNAAIPVLENGMPAPVQDVGDGIVWKLRANVTIDGLTIGKSARASFLIDGEASGNLNGITLVDGDAAKGIVQQNLAMGGAQPTVTSSPAVQVFAAENFEVPADMPLLPAGL